MKPKLVIFLCSLLCVVCSYAQQVTEIAIVPDTPEDVVIDGKRVKATEEPDVMPEYPGGINALMQFLSENIVYPASAAENSIQGRVLVQFVVGTDGKVSNVEIRQGVESSLNEEAIRVVKLLKGWNPGKVDGKNVNVWYVLPISFRLQDDAPEDIEQWDVVEIDSIGYREMMDLGLKAQAENNLRHATAYFKEAYHINPYSIDPLERIVTMNNAAGESNLNYAIYEYGVDELSRWNKLNGTGNGALFPMEWLTEQMGKINSEDLYPQTSLLWTYLQAPSQDAKQKADALLDRLIPLFEKSEQWEQYGHLMSLKSFFLQNEDAVIALFEPNVEKLAKSPMGVGALVTLSQVYKERGDTQAAEKYMKMAVQADPNRIELSKWMD